MIYDDLVMFILYHHHEPQAFVHIDRLFRRKKNDPRPKDLAAFFFVSKDWQLVPSKQSKQRPGLRVAQFDGRISLPVGPPSLAFGRRPRNETKRPTGTNEQIDKSALVDAFCQRRELDSWVRNLVGGVEDFFLCALL